MNTEITTNLVDLAKQGKYAMLTQYVSELLRDMCDQAFQAGSEKGFIIGYEMAAEEADQVTKGNCCVQCIEGELDAWCSCGEGCN